MMGLGEEQDEVVEVFKDLRRVGVLDPHARPVPAPVARRTP